MSVPGKRRSVKTKTVIPKGMYCYTLVEGPLFPTRKHCPYWILLKNSARCSYMNEEGDIDSLLRDQCKICGIKENIGDEHV